MFNNDCSTAAYRSILGGGECCWISRSITVSVIDLFTTWKWDVRTMRCNDVRITRFNYEVSYYPVSRAYNLPEMCCWSVFGTLPYHVAKLSQANINGRSCWSKNTTTRTVGHNSVMGVYRGLSYKRTPTLLCILSFLRLLFYDFQTPAR